QHGDTEFPRRHLPPHLERRYLRWHEQHAVKPRLHPRLLRHSQMPEMHGVETAPEDAETHLAPAPPAPNNGGATEGVGGYPNVRPAIRPCDSGSPIIGGGGGRGYPRTCPDPRTTYLMVVSSSRPIGPRAWSF